MTDTFALVNALSPGNLLLRFYHFFPSTHAISRGNILDNILSPFSKGINDQQAEMNLRNTGRIKVIEKSEEILVLECTYEVINIEEVIY